MLKKELSMKDSLCFPTTKNNLKNNEENIAVFFSMMGYHVAVLKIYADKNNTELMVLQPLLPESWDLRFSPITMFFAVWRTEHRASSVL